MTHPDNGYQIILTPAREQDLDTLLPFVRQFYHHFNYPFDETRKRDVLRHFVKDASQGRIMLVKQDDSEIGYVLIAFSFSLEFNGSIAFVDELFLEPRARRNGIGSRVLAHVESLCAGLGITAVRLETEAYNNRATALYTRLGYHDHERHLMTKRLDSDDPDKGYRTCQFTD